MSMSAAEGNYRPCASALVFNSKREILIGERSDRAGQWQMPQGGIEEGEAPGEAAIRWGDSHRGVLSGVGSGWAAWRAEHV